MKNLRPHRFPPLSQIGQALPAGASAQLQQSHAEAFQEGFDCGYLEGREGGFESGRRDGLEAGRQEGLSSGREEGRLEALARFESIAAPLDAVIDQLRQLQNEYQTAMRKEVVDLVAKVARQVIRSELALQPVQMLALVDETLATMAPTRGRIEVHLNPEELERICELAPDRPGRWTLIPDPRLEPGECRVRAGRHEADAGCRQRLAACMEQVSAQLLPQTEEVQA